MRNKKEKPGPNLIDNEVFEDLKSGIGVSLDAALKVAETQKKEVELTIKIKVDTLHRSDNDKMIQWTEPSVDYKVTRTIKESKFDFKGHVKKSAMKIIDGKIVLESMEKDEPMQYDLFDKMDEKYDV